MLLHYFICTSTAYNTNVSLAVTKQKKDEMPPRVLIHSGMRFLADTQQSKQAIIDQRIATIKTCCYTSHVVSYCAKSSGITGGGPDERTAGPGKLNAKTGPPHSLYFGFCILLVFSRLIFSFF